MIIEKPSYIILTPISAGGVKEMQLIESIGRECYKSNDRITEDGKSAEKFVRMLVSKGHEAMIEHSTLSIKFRVDRGVSHEMVRHRIASFAQESTRYCNYAKDKFGKEIHCIMPMFLEEGTDAFALWSYAMKQAEHAYFNLLESGCTPQEARSVLPNSLATTITITANYREWRNILKLRTSQYAHPQIREVMVPLLAELKQKLPAIFDDIEA